MGVLAPNIVNTLASSVLLPLVFDREEAVTFERTLGGFKIFVPSTQGGWLEVGFHRHHAPSHGARLVVFGPDGTEPVSASPGVGMVRIRVDPKTRTDGVYRAVVHAPTGTFAIYATYTEAARAKVTPWNFWYFPYRQDFEPDSSVFNIDLWDPLTKYEAAFGVEGVLQWELEHHSQFARPDCDGWEGHCHLAAIASVIFEEPKAVEHNGVTFTTEEVKFLAAEVSGRIADFDAAEMWAVSPEFNKDGADEGVKPSDAPERFGGEICGLLWALHKNIARDGQCLVVDMRDPNGSVPEAVWNHAVYAYRTWYAQRDLVDLNIVEGQTTLFANRDDFNPDGSSTGLPTDDPLTRELHYRVRFSADGTLRNDSDFDAGFARLDAVWAPSVTGERTFVPRYAAPLEEVGRPSGASPAASEYENPGVKLEHVLELVKLREG